MHTHRSKGFTLIELLVVIAIIAILAAILFPVFAQAREKARGASCMSNEKQLAQAAMMFAQDNDEKFPGGVISSCYSYGWSGTTYTYCYGPNYTNGPGWASNIYSYVKNTGVFKCPDDSTRGTKITGGQYTSPVSYIYNLDLVVYSYEQSGTTFYSAPAGLPQAALVGPTKTILFMEGINDDANITGKDEAPAGTSGYYSAVGDGSQYNLNYGQSQWGANPANGVKYDTGYLGGGKPSNPNDYNQPTGRHSNGSNFALCDGHVKFIRPEAVSIGAGQYSCYGDPARDTVSYNFTWGGYTIPGGPLSGKSQAVMCPY